MLNDTYMLQFRQHAFQDNTKILSMCSVCLPATQTCLAEFDDLFKKNLYQRSPQTLEYLFALKSTPLFPSNPRILLKEEVMCTFLERELENRAKIHRIDYSQHSLTHLLVCLIICQQTVC